VGSIFWQMEDKRLCFDFEKIESADPRMSFIGEQAKMPRSKLSPIISDIRVAYLFHCHSFRNPINFCQQTCIPQSNFLNLCNSPRIFSPVPPRALVSSIASSPVQHPTACTLAVQLLASRIDQSLFFSIGMCSATQNRKYSDSTYAPQ
jgi:hypothetical protein